MCNLNSAYNGLIQHAMSDIFQEHVFCVLHDAVLVMVKTLLCLKGLCEPLIITLYTLLPRNHVFQT